MKPSRQDYHAAAARHLELVRASNVYTERARHKIRHLNRKIADYEWCLEADIQVFQRDSMERAAKQLAGQREKAIANIREFEVRGAEALLEARRCQRLANRRTWQEWLYEIFWPLEIIRAVRSAK